MLQPHLLRARVRVGVGGLQPHLLRARARVRMRGEDEGEG